MTHPMDALLRRTFLDSCMEDALALSEATEV